jgi:hypothetical protein
MYLIAWNIDNWPVPLPTGLPTVLPDYSSQLKNLEMAKKAMKAVRRSFANIPSYMMFDDDEITDDWNIDQERRDNVYGTEAGRRTVANGLTAFWAFQAWGNDPARPRFEGAIDHFMTYGEPWNGGPLPAISNPLYLPIADEIAERLDRPGDEIPQGDPWLVRIPTTLVHLRPDDKLPGWQKQADGTWMPV